MPTLTVTLTDRRYAIHVEHGAVSRLGEIISTHRFAPRLLLAVDANVLATHGRAARASLEARGFECRQHVLIAEEQRKTLETVRRLYDVMLAERLERASGVIAIGGGVVGDVAGFAAATYLRGVPVVQVPTTLLAMVDASIGGKTGVNLERPPDADGHRELAKNLVGAFWQPRSVVIDPSVLDTLPVRHFRCGLAECVKHGMIADPEIVSFIDANCEGIEAHEPAVLTELIMRSVRVKADIVQEDEREAGRRALLNLGHTFAHAIEPIPELDLRHGEAVAIGLCAAAAAAVALGRFPVADAERVAGLLDRIGLPTRLPRAIDADRLMDAMRYDKKVAGGRLRLVLPCGPGAAEIVDDPDRSIVEQAWAAVGAIRHRGALVIEAPIERGGERGLGLLVASFVVLVAATALRVAGPSDLWDHTQPRTISYTTDIIVHGRWFVPVQDGVYPATKPPLYNWLAVPAVRGAGFASEVAHKSPSLAGWWLSWAGVVGCGALLARGALASNRIDWSLGALAGMVFVANHLVYKLGFLARPDMVLSTFMLLGWWSATSVLVSVRDGAPGRSRTRWAFVFWTCVGLAGLTKGAAAIPLVAYAVLAPPVVARRWTAFGALGWWWGVPWSALFIAAWVGAAWRVDPEHVRDTLWYAEVYGRVTGTGPEESSDGPAALLTGAPDMLWYYVQRFAPWSVFAFSAVIHLFRRDSGGGAERRVLRPGPTVPRLLGAALFVFVVIGLYTLSAGKRADYLLPALGPASLLVAWWIVDVTRRRAAWRWAPVAVAVAIVAGLAVRDRRENTGPVPGFGDSIMAFVHEAEAALDGPPRFAWIWETSLPALLGSSAARYDDPLEALTGTGPWWLITGREPEPLTAYMARRRPDLDVSVVLRRSVVPTAGGETPENATLYRIRSR